MSHTGPLLFDPVLKRIRWGGRRLGTLLGKPLGPHDDYAESWEIADMGPVQSTVATGPLRGTTLADLIAQQAPALLGVPAADSAAVAAQFPLLVKFLDASDRLSLQVHPDDAQAQRAGVGPRGKTEAWIVLDALPNATLFAGLQPGVTRQQLAAAVLSGQVEPLLHRVAVQPGDCLFIPAGTVHALGEGVLLAEVQQSSDTTYRLYDWNRVDATGQPRELHVEAGLACVDFERGPVTPVTPRAVTHPALQIDGSGASSGSTPAATLGCEELVDAPQFKLRRIQASGRLSFAPTGRWAIWIVTQGEIQCPLPSKSDSASLPPARAGTTWFWPADRVGTPLQFAPNTSLIEATCD